MKTVQRCFKSSDFCRCLLIASEVQSNYPHLETLRDFLDLKLILDELKQIGECSLASLVHISKFGENPFGLKKKYFSGCYQ